VAWCVSDAGICCSRRANAPRVRGVRLALCNLQEIYRQAGDFCFPARPIGRLRRESGAPV